MLVKTYGSKGREEHPAECLAYGSIVISMVMEPGVGDLPHSCLPRPHREGQCMAVGSVPSLDLEDLSCVFST